MSKFLSTVISLIVHSLQQLFRRPDWFSLVNRHSIRDDAFAGLTGATIVLPQGIAFAAIAGLPPEYGFYTAMITPVVAALFGSSWHTVSGPTTAISALVFGALSGIYTPGSGQFIEAAVTLALLVGLYQWVLGLARLGALVDFVSHSVMTGFITGAALLIAMTQLKSALGLDLPRPEHLTEFVTALWTNMSLVDPVSLGIALSALATGYIVKRVRPRWPNYLLALLMGTLVYLGLGGADLDVATIGLIPSVIPAFEVPELGFDALQDLASPAFAIAMVGLLEAMSISKAVASKSGQDISSNREFVGQGVSNVVGSFFHCYPGSASFTRSGLNYESGAKTPLSAIFSAIFLFLILLLVAPYFAYVPIPAMAGVIILVAWKLIDFREIAHIFTTSKTESWIAGVTFVSSLAIDLEFAIYAGVLLSLALFLNKTSRPFIGIGSPDPSEPNRPFKNAATNNLPECPQLLIARLDGPLYFGSVEFIRRQFRRFEIERPSQKHCLFIVKGVGEIDLPGAELLIDEAKRREIMGGSFHLQTRTPRTISKLGRFKVMKSLTKHYIHLSKNDAIADIVPTLDQTICATCQTRIFRECPEAPEIVQMDDDHGGEVRIDPAQEEEPAQ
ncbi:MAG: SulP family inorganic anion transporter [Alphaproteobacteria bacterium]